MDWRFLALDRLSSSALSTGHPMCVRIPSTGLCSRLFSSETFQFSNVSRREAPLLRMSESRTSFAWPVLSIDSCGGVSRMRTTLPAASITPLPRSVSQLFGNSPCGICGVPSRRYLAKKGSRTWDYRQGYSPLIPSIPTEANERAFRFWQRTLDTAMFSTCVNVKREA